LPTPKTTIKTDADKNAPSPSCWTPHRRRDFIALKQKQGQGLELKKLILAGALVLAAHDALSVWLLASWRMSS
jgi:hypothetical protein